MSTRAQRIGVVCPYSFDEPGGVQAHILDLAQRHRAAGHEVQVLGPCGPTTQVPSFVYRGGSSFPVRYNGSVARLSFGPRTFSNVRSFIRDGDFDVLHIHEPNSPSFSLAALMVAEGPIVATYHAASSGSKLLTLATPLLRPHLEKIRGGIAVSEMARRWQVEKLGGDPVLIPNGVETSLFRQHRRDPGPIPHVAFLGRLDEPRKGFDIFLRALADLERQVVVDVIGAGEQRRVPGVEIIYHGRVSDEEKARILGAADVYVAPNTGGESFGIVLVEAMAAGAAVVATDLEAFAAVCDADSDSPAGVLFPNGNAEALRGALRQVLDQEHLRARLVSAGSRRAQLFDWEIVSAEVMRVYETVCDGTKVTVV